jgi:hypothetical protein
VRTASLEPLVLALGLAAGLVAAGPVAAQSQFIDRLFTTTEERLHLDELRREYEYGEPAVEAAPVQANVEEDPVVSRLTINGVVLRSSGNNSTWVNGTRIGPAGSTREGIRISEDEEGGVRITLPSGADTIRLKPGQKIDVASGTVLDAYQRAPGEEQERTSAFDLESGESPGSGDDASADAPDPEAGRAPIQVSE